jgi:hypothetical protein
MHLRIIHHNIFVGLTHTNTWTIEGEFLTSFMLIYLQSHNLQGQVELHYS